MTKMTKKVAFSLALTAMNAIDTEEAREAAEIIAKEVARLSVPRSQKPTKADAEKAEFRQTVLELLADNGEKMRATDVANALGVSCQKASAALKVLVDTGAVVKTEGEKRVSLFAIANDEETIEG